MVSDFNKPFSKMTDGEKLAYSSHIQGKYIEEFNNYLKALNNGRIRLQTIQIKQWVEGLRTFRPQALDDGWQDFIQTLRPNYLPSITEAREHFKKYAKDYHAPALDHEEDWGAMTDEDVRNMFSLCMNFKKDGAVLFHTKCIVFWQSMADKEMDPDIKSEHLQAVAKHKELRADSRDNIKKTSNGELRGDRCPI